MFPLSWMLRGVAMRAVPWHGMGAVAIVTNGSALRAEDGGRQVGDLLHRGLSDGGCWSACRRTPHARGTLVPRGRCGACD